MKITDSLVEDAANDGPRDVFLRDEVLRGFGVRITTANSKSFFVEARVHSSHRDSARRITIGHFPAMSVASARKEAVRLLAQMKEGLDPRTAQPAPDRKSKAGVSLAHR